MCKRCSRGEIDDCQMFKGGTELFVHTVAYPTIYTRLSSFDMFCRSRHPHLISLLPRIQVLLCGELLRDSRGRIFLQPWEAPAEAWSDWETAPI